MYPPVSVLIPTYNRPDVLDATIKALARNLSYKGTVTCYIGNDGQELGKGRRWLTGGHTGMLVYCVEQPTGSLGANLNRLLMVTRDDIVIQLDDDHHLMQPLDITPHVDRLLQDDSAGWIRLWLPECTCDGSHYYHFQATMKGGYWAIKPEGELYGPSNRPHIKHKRFHEHFGYYAEGLKLGQTEESFCHQWQERAQQGGGPDVLIPVHLGSPHTWRHGEEVGAKSWQSEGK